MRIAFPLQWSPDGTRLISTDLAGTICVWKTDDKYRLKPISQYNTPSAQTQIAFRCPAVVRHEGVPAQVRFPRQPTPPGHSTARALLHGRHAPPAAH